MNSKAITWNGERAKLRIDWSMMWKVNAILRNVVYGVFLLKVAEKPIEFIYILINRGFEYAMAWLFRGELMADMNEVVGFFEPIKNLLSKIGG